MDTEHMKQTHAALMKASHASLMNAACRCDTGMATEIDGVVIRAAAMLLKMQGHENGPKNLIAVAEKCEKGTATVKDGAYLEYTANANFGAVE